MNWGNGIIFSFVLFAIFIAILVTVCVRQDISLVSSDYYQEELKYQDQITRINNTLKLDTQPVIKIVQNNFIQVDFERFSEIEKGELKLFRPSNAAMDKKFDLKASSTSTQLFETETLPKGMYRARMQWTMNGKEFYIEEIINI